MPNDLADILCCDWNFSRVNITASNWPGWIYHVGKRETTPGLSALWFGRKKQRFFGTNQKPELLRPFGTGLLKPWPQGPFLLFLTFLRPNFFSPFRLFPAPPTFPVSFLPSMWVINIAVVLVTVLLSCFIAGNLTYRFEVFTVFLIPIELCNDLQLQPSVQYFMFYFLCKVKSHVA